MDVNRCAHVGINLHLLTFIGDLRYKMLFQSKHVLCTRRLTTLDINKVYACVFRPAKIPMRTLYKHISLKLMVTFINLR